MTSAERDFTGEPDELYATQISCCIVRSCVANFGGLEAWLQTAGGLHDLDDLGMSWDAAMSDDEFRDGGDARSNGIRQRVAPELTSLAEQHHLRRLATIGSRQRGRGRLRSGPRV